MSPTTSLEQEYEGGWAKWAYHVLHELKRLNELVQDHSKESKDGFKSVYEDFRKNDSELKAEILVLLSKLETMIKEDVESNDKKHSDLDKAIVEIKTTVKMYSSLAGFLGGLIPTILTIIYYVIKHINLFTSAGPTKP